MNASYDLAVNLPLRSAVAATLADTLATFPVGPELLGYPAPAGARDVREAIARWMQEVCGNGAIDPERIVLTIGARQALWIGLQKSIDNNRNPGVLVDELTYHGFRTAAKVSGIRAVDVAMDACGMRPDALEKAAKRSGARAIYLQPTLHNPTTIIMPWERRRDIAAVAEAWDLTIVEGDVYSPLAWRTSEMLPSFVAMLPHRTLHAGGIGKILGPGLRVGWLVLPDRKNRDMTASEMQMETDGLPALLPAVVARWINDGTAYAVTRSLSAAMLQRVAMARRILGPDLLAHDAGLHVWLPTADATAMEKRLTARGVRVASVKGFVGGIKRARGVRLALGAEESLERLEAALTIVAETR